jgi:hypothetical protein
MHYKSHLTGPQADKARKYIEEKGIEKLMEVSKEKDVPLFQNLTKCLF